METNDKSNWNYRDFLGYDPKALLKIQNDRYTTSFYMALLSKYVDSIFTATPPETDNTIKNVDAPADRRGWNWQMYLENSPESLLRMEKTQDPVELTMFYEMLREHAQKWLGKAPDMPNIEIAARYEYLWKYNNKMLQTIQKKEPELFNTMRNAFNAKYAPKEGNGKGSPDLTGSGNIPKMENIAAKAGPDTSKLPPFLKEYADMGYLKLWQEYPQILKTLKSDYPDVYNDLKDYFDAQIREKRKGEGAISDFDYKKQKSQNKY